MVVVTKPGDCIDFTLALSGEVVEFLLSTRTREAGLAPGVAIGCIDALKRPAPPGVAAPLTSPDIGLGVCAGVPYALFELEDTGLASKYEPVGVLSFGPGRAVRIGPGVGVDEANVVQP